jgi:sulfonate transport system substrate-binding protein
MLKISRRALAAIIAVATLVPGAAFATDALKEIHLDWATYNPVSMILKQKGLLEKEFAKDGISIVWVQSAGSNKALEFLRRWWRRSTATRSSRSMSIRAPNGRRW